MMEEVLCVVLVEKVKDWVVVLMEACRKKEDDLCSVEGHRNGEEKLLGLLSKRRKAYILLTKWCVLELEPWIKTMCLVCVLNTRCLGQNWSATLFGSIRFWAPTSTHTHIRRGMTLLSLYKF